MPWRVGDLGDCYDDWAVGKSDEERIRLLAGLFELTDKPLTELPGAWLPGRSPMYRWAIVESTLEPALVLMRVYESQGVFDVIGLEDIR